MRANFGRRGGKNRPAQKKMKKNRGVWVYVWVFHIVIKANELRGEQFVWLSNKRVYKSVFGGRLYRYQNTGVECAAVVDEACRGCGMKGLRRMVQRRDGASKCRRQTRA
jgi:hypothetical protein